MNQRDLEILRLAGAHYRHEGNRDNEARDRFDLSPTRFWQVVAELIEDPAAAVAEPMIVARLRRQRDARLAQKLPRPA